MYSSACNTLPSLSVSSFVVSIVFSGQRISLREVTIPLTSLSNPAIALSIADGSIYLL